MEETTLNPYIKNGLLIIIVALLGGALGLGVSYLIDDNKKPQIEVKQQSVLPISKEKALKQTKYAVIAPTYFTNKKTLYYIFPDQNFKIDYEDGKSNIPLAGLDIMPEDQTSGSIKSDRSFPFAYGTVHIKQNKQKSVIWFNRDKASYQLSIQNSILPQEKSKALAELEKIAKSFKLLKS